MKPCTCNAGIDGVYLCSPCHKYWRGLEQLTSVSHVIYTVFPRSFDGIDPAVLDYAQIRGIIVDEKFCELLETDNVTLDPEQIPDMQNPSNGGNLYTEVKERIEKLCDWWSKQSYDVAETQKIVHSDEIAGTLDILTTGGVIIDLKCTSSLSPQYALQLGAYAAMLNGVVRDVAILHSQKTRVSLKRYDLNQCRADWNTALAWYRTMERLNNK